MSIITVDMPAYDAEVENFAEAGTAAWIEANGGTDVSGEHGEPDNIGTWIGDVEVAGTVYRLTLIEQTREISADIITGGN